MALSINTAETDEMARRLARLTGESMTGAVTTALRERLAREQARSATEADLPARLMALSGRLRTAYDTRPVSREEWDAAAQAAMRATSSSACGDQTTVATDQRG